MYLDYFSLERHPFRITPDPSLFFPGGQDGRGVILNALIYGITSGEGILKVVGEVGSGKTMICRMLEEKLPDTVEIVYLANPRLSAREILYAIAIELKLDVTAQTERLKVMHMLQDYLLNKHGKGGSVVVFVEEAQSMPLETLEEIRLLSNLETHQHKLMQIVLFGQPELDKILAQKNIRQLRERITHSFRLEPLTTQATSEYLKYRLQAAGCPREHIFAPRSEKLIASASSGLTRRINILADKSLLAAYADSPSRQPLQDGDVPLVLPRHVKAAIRDSDYKSRGINTWLLGGLGLATLLVAGVLVVTLELVPGINNDLPIQVTVDTGTVARTPVLEEQVDEQVAAPVEEAVEEVDEEVVEVQIQVPADSGNNEPVIPASDETLLATADQESESDESAIEIMTPDAEPQEPIVLAEAQAEAAATPLPAIMPASENVAMDDPVESQTLALSSTDLIEPETQTMTDAPARPAAGQEQALPVIEESATEEEVLEPPVSMVPSGLAESRMAPTADWLRALDSKSGYTIQMFSVPSTNPNGLEEYLQFLQLVSLLDDTYICFMPISSANSGRWQVMHKEFTGVTPARNFITSLPAYIGQYGPYVRNLNGVECSYPVEIR